MQNIEDKLKDLFHDDSQMPIPQEFAWENMDIQMPSKKKKRFIPIVLGFAAILFLCSVAYLFSFINDEPFNDLVNSEKKELQQIDVNSAQKILSDKDEMEAIEIKEKEVVSNTGILKLNTVIPKSVNRDMQKATLFTNDMTKKESLNSSDAFLTKGIISKVQINESDFTAISKDSNNSQTLAKSVLNMSNIGETPKMSSGKSQKLLAELSSVPTLEIPLESTSLKIDFAMPAIQLPINTFVKTNKTRSLIGFAVGGNYVNREHSSNVAYTSDLISEVEKDAVGMWASLDYGKYINNFISFETGVKFNLVRSIFRYRELINSHTEVESLVVTKENTYRKVVHNNYWSSMSLPLFLKFKVIKRNNFSIDLGLGIEPFYTVSNKGRTLNEELSIINLSNTKTLGVFKGFQLNADYLIGNHSRIGLKFQYATLLNTTKIINEGIETSMEKFELGLVCRKEF